MSSTSTVACDVVRCEETELQTAIEDVTDNAFSAWWSEPGDEIVTIDIELDRACPVRSLPRNLSPHLVHKPLFSCALLC